MKLKQSIQFGICASLLAGAVGLYMPVQANENVRVVYWPTYQDGSANVYTYNPWKQFEINTRVGYITDIQLRPDEVIQKIATGNSVQFSVDTDVVAGIQHVYVKPNVNQVRTNFVVNTDKRSYRFIVNGTSDEYESVVLFTYPELDEKDAIEAAEARRIREEQEQQRFEKLAHTVFNRNYIVKTNKNVRSEYIPRSVFDDGVKTYIEVRPENQDNFPIIYYYDAYDGNKLQLVNYRLKGNYLEIDKIMHKMKLVYSQQSYLVMERNDVKASIPDAKSISFASVDVNDLHAAMEGQAGAIQMQSEWVPLKERMRQQRMKEQKEFIKDTQPQSPPASDPQLDAKIEQLESELGLVNTNISDVSNPSQEGAIQPLNPSDPQAQEDQERHDLQVKIQRIKEDIR